MHSWILLLPYLLTQLLVYIPDVLARHGGDGGPGDYDSDSSGGGGGGSSAERCGIPAHPPIEKWELIPENAVNWTSGGVKSNDQSFDGSFSMGEAYLDYTITDREVCRMRAENPIHMLGYAWVGPQAPYPVGPTNPIIIGFKAWETRKSLDEIGDSYAFIQWDNSCPDRPDLFRLTTSHGWADWDAGTSRAKDLMNMTLAEVAGDRGKVRFNATKPDGLDPPPHFRFGLPGRVCTRDLAYWFEFPDRLDMNGSFSNTTLDLVLSGSGKAETGAFGPSNFKTRELVAEFNVAFSGVFDSVNSTQKLSVRQPGEPLVAWVPNSGVHAASIGWIGRLVWVGTLLLLM